VNATALVDPPVRVVRDLPRVPVGVDEDGAVAAPEGLGRPPADLRAGLASLLGDRVDLLGRSDVDRER
jgi:hypothetical protein